MAKCFNKAMEIINRVKQETDSVLVSFSAGKDSIVLMDLISEHFSKVQPYFMYLVKGLEYQEKTLRLVERRYNVEMIRIPHMNLSRCLRLGVYCLPNRNLPDVKLNDLDAYIREKTGIEWIAVGHKQIDSLQRRAFTHFLYIL